MTDPIEALAEGLRSLSDSLGAISSGRFTFDPATEAQALAATPSVAALLAEAEVGRAVLALGQKFAAEPYATLKVEWDRDDGWQAAVFWPEDDNGPSTGEWTDFCPTLSAAIAAALGDEP